MGASDKTGRRKVRHGTFRYDPAELDRVLKQTLSAIEQGKRQIFDIAENTRTELRRVQEELNQVREEVAEIIILVDTQKEIELKARIHLAEVSRNFKIYTEEDIKQAYEEAQKAQLKLLELRGREKLLRFRRDHLEVSLRRLTAIQEKAENMLTHLGTVLNYLAGNLQDLGAQIGELQQLHQLGLSILRAQEEERRRVAREIHDGPAQVLANIVMQAEFVQALIEMDPARAKEEIKSLRDMVRQSLQDVRQIIFDLRPMVLDDLGLVPAIKKYVEDFKCRSGIPVELLVMGSSQRLPAALEVTLFRVLQESLHNIRKHAGECRVTVKLEILPQKVNLMIRDTGKGFDPKDHREQDEHQGYGLVGMRERTQLLKGELSISSAPGQGTVILVSVPLNGPKS
ncbi:MAG TPA: histidine kinase [Desulfotomaculum sp.]|nr:histidine kinase [Desulfotomaculum sp.]